MVAVSDESVVSPRNRVKFLCSHGGRILPRPIDGQLKYVGGETRVVAVPRDISFSELMKKLSSLFEANVVLKYQLLPEDLDALISVTCDEDLQHMFEEFDRQDGRRMTGPTTAPPRLRAFLFPMVPTPLLSPRHRNPKSPNDPLAFEQRYIDAVNGIVRPSPISVNSPRPIFTISSSGDSSPKSTTPGLDVVNSEPIFSNTIREPYEQIGSSQQTELHRVRSSPSLLVGGLHSPHPHPHLHHHPPPHNHHLLLLQKPLNGSYRLAAPPPLVIRNDPWKCQIGQIPRRHCSPLQRAVTAGQVDEWVCRNRSLGEVEDISALSPPVRPLQNKGV